MGVQPAGNIMNLRVFCRRMNSMNVEMACRMTMESMMGWSMKNMDELVIVLWKLIVTLTALKNVHKI